MSSARFSDMPLSDRHKQMRWRNIAVALILLGLVVLFFFITIAKMGGQTMHVF
jgi:hypothetical protein